LARFDASVIPPRQIVEILTFTRSMSRLFGQPDAAFLPLAGGEFELIQRVRRPHLVPPREFAQHLNDEEVAETEAAGAEGSATEGNFTCRTDWASRPTATNEILPQFATDGYTLPNQSSCL
jgi:hypothetical protein